MDLYGCAASAPSISRRTAEATSASMHSAEQAHFPSNPGTCRLLHRCIHPVAQAGLAQRGKSDRPVHPRLASGLRFPSIRLATQASNALQTPDRLGDLGDPQPEISVHQHHLAPRHDSIADDQIHRVGHLPVQLDDVPRASSRSSFSSSSREPKRTDASSSTSSSRSKLPEAAPSPGGPSWPSPGFRRVSSTAACRLRDACFRCLERHRQAYARIP